MRQTLHAVRAAEPITAAEAAARFAGSVGEGRSGPQVIGYALSPRAATWVRIRPDGTAEDVTGVGDVLAEAYEIVLFDGDRELRWLRTPDGYGVAVALGEDPTALPAWPDATADPQPVRGDDVQIRMLTGVASAHSDPNWTILKGRHAPAYLPYPYRDGEVLTVETVEYLVEDEHGNLDVADTRIRRLSATTLQALRTDNGPASERTAS